MIIGVQPVLDCIIDYLPSPLEKPLIELIDEKKVPIKILPDPAAPFCALAFKVH